jgi:hypothetical protein
VRGVTSTGGYGVSGETAGSSGAGVYGINHTDTGIGVFGVSRGTGVSGNGNNGPGLFGYSAYGPSVAGQSRFGFAGDFIGTLRVTDSLSKGGGSFKIDHPLDPANKCLSHSFVESPDMLNIYNGNITTDEKGEATITLPEWFEALNEARR